MLDRVLTNGEIRLLDCLQYSRDELRQLMQRWDNRLTIERISFIKQYCEGRLSLLSVKP